VSKELRIGATGVSLAGEVDDPYAGVNLAAAENPNFADGMNHWTYNTYWGAISAVDTLPMEFTQDPAVTTGCLLNSPVTGTGSSFIAQDKVAIPDDMRASLPCDFTASYWSLQVGGSEDFYTWFIPWILYYDAAGDLIVWANQSTVQQTDTHTWQRDAVTQTVPATAYYLALSIQHGWMTDFDMYYTAAKLERASPGPPARNLEAFSVTRDAAGILLAVRDNAAPQFSVGRDADGLSIMVPR
jgi:hypothetical protein